MLGKFNHAANDSPRSGSSTRAVPAIWAAIVLTIVVATIWYLMNP